MSEKKISVLKKKLFLKVTKVEYISLFVSQVNSESQAEFTHFDFESEGATVVSTLRRWHLSNTTVRAQTESTCVL